MYQRKKKNFLMKFFKRIAKRTPILWRQLVRKMKRFFKIFAKHFIQPIKNYITKIYLKIKDPILLTRVSTIVIIIALFGGFAYRVFATPPTSQYTPGETLNPSCGPTETNCSVAASGSVGGSGTSGYLPKWTGTTSLGSSLIYDDGTNLGIGTTTPGYKFHLKGDARIETATGKHMTWTTTGNGIAAMLSGNSDDLIGISSFNTYLNQGKIYLYGYSSIAGYSSGTRGDFLFRNEDTSTDLMYLSPVGNLGIGTTSPSSKLDITTTALGTTQTTTSGLALVNTTAAAAGAQQISPAIRWSAKGWKTDATAGSQAVDFRSYVLPVQGTASPTGSWFLESAINGGSYTKHLTVTSAGNVGIGITSPQYALDVNGSIRMNGSIVSSNGNGILVDYGNHNVSVNADGSAGSVFIADGYGVSVFIGRDSNRSVFEGSGNFGLNTQTPTSLFQIDQSTNGRGTVLVVGSDLVTGSDTQFTNTFKVGDTINVATIIGLNPPAVETRTISSIESDTTMHVSSPFDGSNSGGYSLVGGTRFVVNGNGNIGIGTTDPTTILEIASSDMGSGNAGPIITLGRNTNATTGAGSIDFLRKDGTHGYVWQDNAGEMRINTTISPSNANDTSGTVIGTQASSLSSKNLAGLFTDYSNALDTIVNAPLYNFTYKSGAFNNQQFTGIITDYTPEFGMDKDASHPAGKSLNVITGLGYTFGAIKELNAITVQYDTNNNVGIGTENPFEKLHVSDVTTSGIVARFENSTGTCDINPTTSSLTCSSDINKKKNITSLDNTSKVLTVSDYYSPEEMNLRIGLSDEKTILDKINMLTPVTYNWNTESDSDKKHIGFIAQEVEQLFPDLVETDPRTGFKSLNYGGFTPYLIKGFQEQQKQIEELKLQIAGISAILTPQSSVLSMMTEFFSSVVVQVSGGVGYLKDITVETLKIGSPEKRTGITLFDEVTGEPYCISVANGAQKITSGECSVVLSSPDSDDDSSENSGLGGGGGILSDSFPPDESNGGSDVSTSDSQNLTPNDSTNSGELSSSDSSVAPDSGSGAQTQTTPTIETTSI